MAFFYRFAGLLALAFSVFVFFACQKNNQPPTLSAAYRELPDSIFSGKLPPAEFLLAVHHLPKGVDLDTAYQRLFDGPAFYSDMDLFMRHLDFYEKAPQIEGPSRAWIDTQRGVIFDIKGRPDSSRIFFERAEALARANNFPRYISQSLAGLADLDIDQNRPISAANRLKEAFEVSRTIGDSVRLMEISRTLAQCHIIQKSWKKAEAAAREGLVYISQKTSSAKIAAVESVLVTTLLEQKKLDEAAVLIQKNLVLTTLPEQFFYRDGWLMRFARLRMSQNKPLEALDSLRAVERLQAKIANIPQAVSIRELLFSEAFAAIGQKNEAVAHAEKALKLAEPTDNLPHQARAASALAKNLEAAGQTLAAFSSLKKYRALADSLYQKSEKGHFEDLLEQEKADAQKRQVIALAAVADQERQRKWFVGIFGLFAALAIAVSARLRRKNERLKTEKAAAEQAALLREAEAKMALQSEQLDDFARFVVEKNQQIEALRAAAPSDSGHRAQPSETEDVEALYAQSILTEADWERFKAYFERVHPGFLARLRHRWPELTAAETRLILLIKMGMSGRDMASMLGVAAETVKKTRYRLRKKLDLDDERLEAAVAAI